MEPCPNFEIKATILKLNEVNKNKHFYTREVIEDAIKDTNKRIPVTDGVGIDAPIIGYTNRIWIDGDSVIASISLDSRRLSFRPTGIASSVDNSGSVLTPITYKFESVNLLHSEEAA